MFNKTDVQPHQFALDWMSDFEEFQAALATHQGARDSEGEPTYMNSLMNSMSLVLDEFYKNLRVRLFFKGAEVGEWLSSCFLFSLSQAVGVSSVTGDGVKEFFEAVDASREEYERSVLIRVPMIQVANVLDMFQGISS